VFLTNKDDDDDDLAR